MTSFYSEDELRGLGLGSVGRDVQLSRHAQLYVKPKIHLGHRTRVDDFCILSGNIHVGDCCHLAAGSYLFAGGATITLGDYVVISSRVSIYAASDDFSGESLILNPSIETPLRTVIEGNIELARFAAVGSSSILLPGASMAEGAVLGAMSMLKHKAEPWSIYAGTPAVLIKPRSKNMKALARHFERA